MPTQPRRLTPEVYGIAAAVLLVLMCVAGRYGFHRDEYYFVVTGQHRLIAAPDNPMGVPYLAAGWYRLVGGHLWAFRFLPALAAAGYVVVGGLIARDLGGDRAHQIAGATATALLGVVPPVGHLFSTTTFDMLATATALWLLIRALDTAAGRWSPWLWFGLALGIALECKVLAILVLGCALIGLLALGPRTQLRTPQPWAGALLAVLIGAPNLIWQTAHGWPMLKVASAISQGGSTSSTPRVLLLPITALEIGPVLVVVLVIGLVHLLRMPQRREHGWLAVGFLVFVVLMLVAGGKAYYPAGFYPALAAVGGGVVLDWCRRVRWRRMLVAAAACVSAVVTACLTLPLFPVGSAGYAVGMGPNPDMGETVGWHGDIDTVAQVANALPAAGRRDRVVLTENYGEAGALYLARQAGTPLPAVFSGDDAFALFGPPPAEARQAIVVGTFSAAQLAGWFDRCRVAAHLRSPEGADNQEDGAPVRVCTGLHRPWSAIWPQASTTG